MTDRKQPTDSDPPTVGEVLATNKRLKALTTRTPADEAAFQQRERELTERLAATELRTAADRLLRDLGERYTPDRVGLDRYAVYHADQKPVMKRLRDIAGRLDDLIAEGAGLVLFGWVGTGKDHLAASLLYLAARKHRCRWVNGRQLFAQSRDRIKEERVERELIEMYTAPAVLCISDPVPVEGRQSDWNVDLLYRLIDERYRLLRPTWLTINATSEDDAAARLTRPVWDRLRDQAELIGCFWPSFRRERKS